MLTCLLNFRTNEGLISSTNRVRNFYISLSRKLSMETKKRNCEPDSENEELKCKCPRIEDNAGKKQIIAIMNGKSKPVPQFIIDKLTDDEIDLMENINTSCTDQDKIKAAIKLRRKYRFSVRLPEDLDDSSYYIQDGLRKVYPYPYLYQSYAKRRWLGRKLKDVIREEFRDITEEQLKERFDSRRILVNGEDVEYDYVIKDNDFISNRNHRHELAVLATPMKIIHEDKDTLVIDKPPSMPIHPCGRFRHNTVVNILHKEYNYKNVKVVHRLDRLVSGVLIIAKNTGRANFLENMIKNRDVQKEYVCRVEGKFPTGKPEDDGYVVVNRPLDTVEGKIGITVVSEGGKESITKFKLLHYNGKSSAVLCKPLTGRMHQIRVHLQYLGHPIINDALYNSDAFGPEKGKGGRIGKSFKQLSLDILDMHRASSWLIADGNDVVELADKQDSVNISSTDMPTNEIVKFLSNEEREETMAALEHFFTNESWKDLEQRCRFNPEKMIRDPSCRDCNSLYYDPPLRRLFLYLHAYRYSGTGWSYESEMPVWARDTWNY